MARSGTLFTETSLYTLEGECDEDMTEVKLDNQFCYERRCGVERVAFRRVVHILYLACCPCLHQQLQSD